MQDNLLQELLNKRAELDKDIQLLMGDELNETETLLKLEQRVHNKPKKDRYLTGIDWLDEKTRGIQEGTFINLAGQSFSGKSTLALKILSNIAAYKEVFFASFEMYENKLVDKLKHLTKTQKANMNIVQKSYKLDQIESIIRKQAKAGVRFFVLDSRMKIVVMEGEKEYQKISFLSNKLSKLCQELGIIIILINQTSEEDLKQGRFSLKGSGDQFYDSDIVLFLAITKIDNQEKRWCFCKKDRDGGRIWDCDITEPTVEVIEYKE